MQRNAEFGAAIHVADSGGTWQATGPAGIDLVAAIGGIANEGFFYGNLLDHPVRPLRIARGVILAGGFTAVHDTANHYIVVVTAGRGAIVIYGAQGIREQRLQTGDVAVLPPATTHEWRGGDEDLHFVGIELLA